MLERRSAHARRSAIHALVTNFASAALLGTCRRPRRTACSTPMGRRAAPGFRREAELFFESIMRDDRNVVVC